MCNVLQSLRCFFIEPANGFFAVDAVYGRSDDATRFDFFSKVATVSSLPFPAHPYAADVAHLCRAQMNLHARLIIFLSVGDVCWISCVRRQLVAVAQGAAVQAALEFLLQTGRQPDVLHCHDWSTASLAQSYWCAPRHPCLDVVAS